MKTITVDYAVLMWMIIILFGIVGSFRGWWREGLTTGFLTGLVVLLRLPGLAEMIINFLNKFIKLVYIAIKARSLDIERIAEVAKVVENIPIKIDPTDYRVYITGLIGTLIVSYIMARISVNKKVITPTFPGSVLGAVFGLLNGFTIISLVREYMVGRYLPGSTVTAEVPVTIAVTVPSIPTPSIVEGWVYWLIVSIGALLLFAVFSKNFWIKAIPKWFQWLDRSSEMRRIITIVGILGVLTLIAGALLVASQWFVPRTVIYSTQLGSFTDVVTAQIQTSSTSMTYRVQSGDTLTEISRKLFNGDPQYWDEIADLNNIKAPYVVYPGQELLVPEKGEEPETGLVAIKPIEFDPAYPVVEVLGAHQFSVESCARLEVVVKSPHNRAVSLIDAGGRQVPFGMGYCDESTCYLFSVSRPVTGTWQLYSPTLCEAQFICHEYDVVLTLADFQHLVEDKPIEIAVSVVDAKGAVAEDALVAVFIEDPSGKLIRRHLTLDGSGSFRTAYDHGGSLGRYILNVIVRVDNVVEERERAVYVVSHPYLVLESVNSEQALEDGSLDVKVTAYTNRVFFPSLPGELLRLRGGKWVDDSEASTEDSVRIIATLSSQEDRRVSGPIPLHDDGETPDDSRLDGTYSGTFPDVRDGQYTLAVTLTVNTSSFTASNALLQDIIVPFKCFPVAEVESPSKIKAGESGIVEVTLNLSRTNPGFSPDAYLLSSRNYRATVGPQLGNLEVTSAELETPLSQVISAGAPAKWALVISPKAGKLGEQQMVFNISISDAEGRLVYAPYLSTRIEVTNPLGLPAEIGYVISAVGAAISVPILAWFWNEWSKRQQEKRKAAREEAKCQHEARTK